MLDGLLRLLQHYRHVLVHKAILGLLPSYLQIFISQRSPGTYCLRSLDVSSVSIPRVRAELGKQAFRFAASFAWNELQKDLKLHDLSQWMFSRECWTTWRRHICLYVFCLIYGGFFNDCDSIYDKIAYCVMFLCYVFLVYMAADCFVCNCAAACLGPLHCGKRDSAC